MILFIKHISIEGPGTIPEFIQSKENVKIVELDQGEPLPDDFSSLEAVVSLGGPMNVYEEEKYPFLKKEDIFLKEVLKRDIPLLGVCLGSQLIAKALGAKVTKSPKKEIGWDTVNLTESGRKDPLFEGVDPTLGVFQWHEDTFAIPESAAHLAQSPACSHQAFRLGRSAYGLQFHIEVTDDIIASWVEKYFKVSNARDHQDGKQMLDQYSTVKDEFNHQAQIILNNFQKLIKKSLKDAKDTQKHAKEV